MKWEFDAAGIAWEPFGARVRRMVELIEELGRLFGGPGYAERAALAEHFGLAELAPVQRTGFGGSGPPLLVGGTPRSSSSGRRGSSPSRSGSAASGSGSPT